MCQMICLVVVALLVFCFSATAQFTHQFIKTAHLYVFRTLDQQRGKHHEFVFVGIHNQRLHSVRKPFLAATQKAGILNFRFHDLRHTFASHFVMKGGDLLTLKEILGHSSMQMVEKYAYLAAAHKRRQINNLKGLFSNCHPIATSQVETKKAL